MFGVKIVHELLVIIFVTWKRRNHFLKYQVNFGDTLYFPSCYVEFSPALRAGPFPFALDSYVEFYDFLRAVTRRYGNIDFNC